MTERVCSRETCGYAVSSQTSRWSFPDNCPQCGSDLEQPTTDAATDRQTIRRTVRAVVTDDSIDKGQTISDVASRLDSPEEIVREELNELEQHGFVHLAGDGDSAEVRLP